MLRSRTGAELKWIGLTLLLALSAGWCSPDPLPADDEQTPKQVSEGQETDRDAPPPIAETPAAPKPPAEPKAAADKQAAQQKPVAKPGDAKSKKNWLSDWLKDVIPDAKKPADKPNRKRLDRQKLKRPQPVPRRPLGNRESHRSEELDPRVPDPLALNNLMRSARTQFGKGEWKQATAYLQRILKSDQDAFTLREDGSWGSIHREALALLGKFPPEERQAYQAQYEGIAGRELEIALRDGDATQLITVATRYLYTPSGQRAANLVGSRYLDRGEFGLAKRWFDLLRSSGAAITQSPAWQAKAALADKFAGALAVGGGPADAGINVDLSARLGGLEQKIAHWLEIVALPRVSETFLDEWLQPFGTSSRTGRSAEGHPILLSRWHEPLTHSHRIQKQVKRLVEDFGDQNLAMISNIAPVTSDGKIVFRTLRGVQVLDSETGAAVWETQDRVPAEQLLTGSSSKRMNRFGRQPFRSSSGGASSSLSQLLFENANFGIISSDGRLLFVIEDLAVLTRQSNQYWGWQQSARDQWGQDWSCNKLVAYELDSGRPLWEVGGPQFGDVFELPLTGYFFHGAPLVDGDELFLIGEKDSQIELICLDSTDGAVKWRQALANAQARIEQDVVRRRFGAQPAVSQGVIVCPTTTGLIVAVERQSHGLLWSYRVSTTGRQTGRGNRTGAARAEPLNKRWCPAPPIIVGDRVVITPPTGKYVYCLDLISGEDGRGAGWKKAKGSKLLYLAGVFDETVLIVGKESIHGFDLKTGADCWPSVELPANPSGRGTAAGNRYYLPLAGGELFGIDLETGDELGVSRRPSAASGRPLGNLTLYRGSLISLGSFGAESLELQEQIEADIAELKENDPRHPLALLREAEYVGLTQDSLAALQRLRMIDRDQLSVETRGRYQGLYFRTLMNVVRQDFSRFDAEMAELQELAVSEEEQIQVRRLFADRLTARGDLEEAWDAYLQLAELSDEAPIDTGEGVEVRADLWVAGRIRDLWNAASAEQRQQFDLAIAASAAEAQTRDADAQRSWLTIYEFHPESIRVQLRLAESYANSGDLIAAEKLLLTLRDSKDKSVAAEATESWGRLLLSAGASVEAALIYQELEQEYGEVKLDGGRTGAELAAAAREEHALPEHPQRYLPISWGDDPFTAVWMGQDYSQQSVTQSLNSLEPDLPFFSRHRLRVRQKDLRLEIVRADDDLFRALIPLRGKPNRSGARLRAYHEGHHLLLVHQGLLHSVSPLEKKIRWTRPVEAVRTSTPRYSQYGRAASVRGSWGAGGAMDKIESALAKQRNYLQRQPYLVDDRYFGYRSRRQYTVLDAQTGRVCWTLKNVPLGTVFFGGDGLLYRRSQDDHNDLTAYRMLDGKVLELPYIEKNVRRTSIFIGRRILQINGSREKTKALTHLSCVDPVSGDEVWSQTFPKDTRASFRSAGRIWLLQPGGEFTELDLETGRMKRLGQVDAKFLQSRQIVYSFQDNENAYLVLNRSSRRSRILSSNNLRSLTVSGVILAFDLNTGESRWPPYQVKKNWRLLLSGLEDSPVLLFTASENEQVASKPLTTIKKLNLLAVSKATGREVLEATVPIRSELQNVRVSSTGKFIELWSYNQKVRVMPDRAARAAAHAPPSND